MRGDVAEREKVRKEIYSADKSNRGPTRFVVTGVKDSVRQVCHLCRAMDENC